MGEILGVSKRTVKRRLRKYNISLRDRYSNLSDSDLDNLVREVVGGNDELGAEALRARLADTFSDEWKQQEGKGQRRKCREKNREWMRGSQLPS
ncbi:unnamed protein product [Leuciscus chuanchicus]